MLYSVFFVSKVFGDSPNTDFFRPNKLTENIAKALINSADSSHVFNAIVNTTAEVGGIGLMIFSYIL